MAKGYVLQCVFAALESELAYSEKKHSEAGRNHEIAAWLTYMRDYLTEAERIVSRTDREADALDTIRKVTALGVACMAEHGAPQRSGYFVSVEELT